jgi:hypothetical protein
VENAIVIKPQGTTERFQDLSDTETPALFPNPTSGSVLIALPADWQDQPTRFLVSNAQGQLVQEETTTLAGEQYMLTMNPVLGSGFYYITLQRASGEKTTLRCVLQR